VRFIVGVPRRGVPADETRSRLKFFSSNAEFRAHARSMPHRTMNAR